MRRRRASEARTEFPAPPNSNSFSTQRLSTKHPSQLKLDFTNIPPFFLEPIYKIKSTHLRLLFQDIIIICDFMLFFIADFI